MEISSADFMKLTLQEVVDFLLDHESKGAICKGTVDNKLYKLSVNLEMIEDD